MRQVEFLGGISRSNQYGTIPIPNGMTLVAFAGRSNVGKSSLLNALTNSKMARVSKTPGKTREVNFFSVGRFGGERSYIFTDLPGYGYAQVGADLRRHWGTEITKWIKECSDLTFVFLLIDSRRGILDVDFSCIELLREVNLPFSILFTKMDKWKSTNELKKIEKKLREDCSENNIESFFFTSSEKKIGISEIKSFLGQKTHV